MTEDLLEEQSEVLAKLGTSAEGTHLRARMQSACLLSDMESFKVNQADIHIFNPYLSIHLQVYTCLHQFGALILGSSYPQVLVSLSKTKNTKLLLLCVYGNGQIYATLKCLLN